MSASSGTPNFNLPQFSPTDKPSWGGDFNNAMLKIDTAMQVLTQENGTLTASINLLTERLNLANTQLRALGQAGV
jgi:hypothetical protein